MEKRCCGCMQIKTQSPLCEHCGYNENIDNLPHQLPIGTRLQDRYEVGKALGQGGFGITYIGWDHEREVPVAIKEFYPNGIVNRDAGNTRSVFLSAMEGNEIFERNKARFLKEAHTLARLNYVEEIVHVHSLFEENNTAYIVMEYLKGVDLRQYIRMVGGRLSPELTFAILQPIMVALQKLHDEEMVHRDISPDNIMIMNDGTAKLLDFGSAREVLDADPEKFQNRSTEAVLKHGFAPMEQYQRNGNMGPWTDVYSLSATIYYCLTGRIPADAPNRIMDGETIPWDKIPGLTPEQIQALTKAMEVLPKDRTRSIRELARGLFGEEKKPEPKPEPKPEKKAKKKKKAKPRKKGRLGKILIGLAAAAVVAVGAFLVMQNVEFGSGDRLDKTVFEGGPDGEISYEDGSRMEIYRDGAGRENGRILRDSQGTILFQITADYTSGGDILYQYTYDGNDSLLRKDIFTYNVRGDLSSCQLILGDGTVYRSTVHEYDGNGDIQRSVTCNSQDQIMEETVYTHHGDRTLASSVTTYEDGTVVETVYDAYGDPVTETKRDSEGKLVETLQYTQYRQILVDIQMFTPDSRENDLLSSERGGWSGSDAADGRPAPYGSGSKPSGALGSAAGGSGIRPAMWQIDNGGGGGGGGGSKKKKPSTVYIAITEPVEEETVPPTTEPEETTEPFVPEETVVVVEGTQRKRMNTRREQFGPNGELLYSYIMEYDSEGRILLEICRTPNGEEQQRTEYAYPTGNEEACTVTTSNRDGSADVRQSMKDICGNEIRRFVRSGDCTGYEEFSQAREFVSFQLFDADGSLVAQRTNLFDENGIYQGYTAWNIDPENGGAVEVEFNANNEQVAERLYDRDGNLIASNP